MSPVRDCTQEVIGMSAKDNGKGRMPEYREKWLKRFAKRFEPYGILITVCALGVSFATLLIAFVTLWVEIALRKTTLTILEEENKQRKATQDALENEKILRDAELLDLLLEHFELSRSGEYSGHVKILEQVAGIQMDLRNLDASAIDFYFDAPEGGINLNNADLREVYFDSSNLTYAKLANTKLNGASLKEAELRKANLINADLTGADLRQADMNLSQN